MQKDDASLSPLVSSSLTSSPSLSPSGSILRNQSFNAPPKPRRKERSSTSGDTPRPVLLPEQAATIIQRRWRYWVHRTGYMRIRRQVLRRNRIVQEILSTESSYLSSLRTLTKVFLSPLESSGIADEYGELKSLFGGIKVIIGYNTFLLNDLQQRVPTWHNHSKLGDVFLRLVQFLKAYTQYVNTYKQTIDAFEKLKLTKQYVEWEAKLDKTECGGLQLGDYLIMPIQRLPRYNMLLDDLVKNTWKFHIDYENLRQAHQKIMEIALFVNASQREADNQRKISEILNTIHGVPSNFVEPWRRFVHDGHLLDESGKTLHFYLFNDVLLFAKIKKDKKFFDKREDLLNISLSADESSPTGLILKEGREDCLYTAASASERTRWIDAFQEATTLRLELKKASDELILKNLPKRIGSDHSVLNFKRGADDNEMHTVTTSSSSASTSPAGSTIQDKPSKASMMRKTASSGNLGSIFHHSKTTHDKEKSVVLEDSHSHTHLQLPTHTRSPSTGSSSISGNGTDEDGGDGEESEKKRKMRRTPSLKNLLNIVRESPGTNSTGPVGGKGVVSALLSPRVEKGSSGHLEVSGSGDQRARRGTDAASSPVSKITVPSRATFISSLNTPKNGPMSMERESSPEPSPDVEKVGTSRARAITQTLGFGGLGLFSKKEKEKEDNGKGDFYSLQIPKQIKPLDSSGGGGAAHDVSSPRKKKSGFGGFLGN